MLFPQQRTQCVIHSFRVGKRRGNIRIKQHYVCSFAVALDVLTSHTTRHLRKVIFGPQIVVV